MSAGGRRSVVFVNRFYWPDVAATGQLLQELAEDLAAAGWAVTVVASRRPYDAGAGTGAEGDASGPLPRREVHRGVEIVRIRTPGSGRASLPGRLVDSVAFLLGACLHLARRSPAPAVVVPLTDPPGLAVPAGLVALLRGTRCVRWVHDVYPEIAGRLGVIPPDGMVHRVLAVLEAGADRSSDAVVALGRTMAEVLAARAGPGARVACIPNWIDTHRIRPVPRESNPFLDAHDLGSRFVVQYSGNAGRAHRFEEVLEAARILEGEEPVTFLFVGGGVRRPALEAAVEREGLGNVRFLGYRALDELADSLSAAHVALVTEEPEVLGLVVPSKTYGILAAATPVLYVGPEGSDVAAILAEHRCGWRIPVGEPARLVEAIRRLRDDDELRGTMGRRAREAAETRFDRRIAVGRWEELLSGVVAGVVPPRDAESPTPCARWAIAGVSADIRSKPSAPELEGARG